MNDQESPIRGIADTAQWAAYYRARETERADALFRDPFARILAGNRGEEIARSLGEKNRNEWAWVTRTFLFDQFIARQVADGVDMVVNLGAGLDTRPYRMELPATLSWVEVDAPELLALKEATLKADRPRCRLERVPMDLADVAKRRSLFARLGGQRTNAVVVTEGLLIYLAPDEVASLARDLAAAPGFRHWIFDIVSPGLLKMLSRTVGTQLSQAGAPLKFGPVEGPDFFSNHGWNPVEQRSVLGTAAQNRRVSFFMRLLALLADSPGPRGSRPWSAVCHAERASE